MEMESGEKGPDSSSPPEQPGKQLKVTYELYKKIANMLVHHLRQVEEHTGERGHACVCTCVCICTVTCLQHHPW